MSGLHELLRSILAWIEGLGPAAPAAFIALYALGCVLLIPGSLLTLGAGLLFGVLRGSIYVSMASTAGATAAFLIGRYLARDWVARKIQGNPVFRAIDEAVAAEGWKIVLLARLSPVFPFNLLNYALGLTRVPLLGYVLASWVGMMPATVMYVYLGSLAGGLAGLGSGQGAKTPAQWALYLLGLAATLAAALQAARIARAALKRKIDARPPSPLSRPRAGEGE